MAGASGVPDLLEEVVLPQGSETNG
jgi:hypothetical protein